jgi:hypothetical protein
MTFPLAPTPIVLGLSPADSDACTGTALLINLSNLECRPVLPPRPRLNVKRRKAFATIPIVPNLPRLRSIRLL